MIYAIGETVMDILFKNDKPIDAVPGGSAYNSVISIGRAGIPCSFIGYTGQDHVGDITVQFLQDNGIDTQWFEQREGTKSYVSLAFLDEAGDAHYVFYKDSPRMMSSEEILTPHFQSGDALLLGSYYAISNGTRAQIKTVLEHAKNVGAAIYYDLNFRSSHKDELDNLMPAIHENFAKATFVRGSADDFDVMWGVRDARKIYREHIAEYCPMFICTAGAGLITVCTPQGEWDFEVPRVDNVISTVGAGDNFNAGFLCAMALRNECSKSSDYWTRETLAPLVDMGVRFAAAVCRTTDNYIPVTFRI